MVVKKNKYDNNIARLQLELYFSSSQLMANSFYLLSQEIKHDASIEKHINMPTMTEKKMNR